MATWKSGRLSNTWVRARPSSTIAFHSFGSTPGSFEAVSKGAGLVLFGDAALNPFKGHRTPAVKDVAGEVDHDLDEPFLEALRVPQAREPRGVQA